MTVLKPKSGNKAFSNRLTRWVDRLLPFEFEVVFVAGRTLGIANYLSGHPSELEGASINAETLWNEWFTVNSLISLNNVLENWRERFQLFSVDEKNLLYMDNCLVIPQ